MNRTRSRGWMLFAATLLLLTGAINLIQGIIALVTTENLFAFGGEAFFFNLTPWGFLLGLWGLLLLGTGIALFTKQSWARALGVVLLAINIVAQLGFVAANPLWALTIVAIDLVGIYALTAGWSSASARESEEAETSYRSGYAASTSEAPAAGAHIPQQQSRGESQSRGEHAR